MTDKFVRGRLMEKNGSYYTRVMWHEQQNGRTKYRDEWRATGLQVKGNKRSAEKILAERVRKKEAELQSGKISVNNRISVSAYMLQWLEYRKDDKLHPIREDTYEGYERKIKRHVVPYFDKLGIILTDLTAEDLDEFYAWLLKEGSSVSSVRKIHANIHAALKRAMKMHLVYRNVAEDTERLPGVENNKGDFYNEKELKELFAKCKGDPLETVIKLAAFFGLRRSEVLGLKWSAVDFDNQTITIKGTVIQTRNGAQYLESVKSTKSHRVLLVPDAMLEYLKLLKETQKHDKEVCGNSYEENDFICKWPSGHPITPSYVSHHFTELLRMHGLRHIRFHDLRHSAASLLLSNGLMLKDVQEFLGHSTIAITADIYGHLDQQRKTAVAKQMEAGLGGALGL